MNANDQKGGNPNPTLKAGLNLDKSQKIPFC